MTCVFSTMNRGNEVCVFTLDKPIVITCSGEDFEKEDCPFWNGRKIRSE